MMKLLRGSFLAAAMVVGFAGFASADEITATVDNVDATAKTVTIAGMTMALPDSVDPGSIEVGNNYDVMYGKDGGKMTVQQITPHPK
jgi:hypothetical protein